MSKGERTRHAILQVAFDLIYSKGYQATSIDDILENTSVTKGAFFYHFKSKDDMGIAMIREILYPGMVRIMIDPLLRGTDARRELFAMMKGLLTADDLFVVDYGCPAVNLIEEMSFNRAFASELRKLSDEWQKAIVACVRNGISRGQFGSELKPDEVAVYVVSGYGGVRNMGKLYGKSVYSLYLKAFEKYLEAL